MDIEKEVESITNELHPEWFHINNRPQLIKDALKSILGQEPLGSQTDNVSNCFEEFWKEYSNENLARALKNFPKMESALYGLLREGSERYRDHYIHMFNNFIFGGQILTQIALKCDESQLSAFFKVEKEIGLPSVFIPYSSLKRLFFLWTLITNFHDIGIPMERINDLTRGLDNYLDYFGYNIAQFALGHHHSLEMESSKYISIMGALFTNGIRPKGGIYEIPLEANRYVYKALSDAFDKHDQGIMAAIGLFNNIEDTFFRRTDKYKLNSEEFLIYYQRVLTQDIARAALAIAIHNLKPKDYPHLFPIAFSKLPITFLFILCDEIGEFFRPEGITYSPLAKLKKWPGLGVNVFPEKSQIHIEVKFSYGEVSEADMFTILEQAAQYLEQRGSSFLLTTKKISELKEKGEKGLPEAFDELNKYFSVYWDEREKHLGSKLELKSEGEIYLNLSIEMPTQKGRSISKTYKLGVT